jgi:hypothetical protein
MGAQVRTDRLPDSTRARQLATDEQRRLLRDVADEAGSEAPLEGDAQLELRLAALRARRSGGEPHRLLPEVRRDLATVKAAYSTGRQVNVGTREQPEQVSWWEAYIERPLGRRHRVSDLPALTQPYGAEDAQACLDLRCPSSEAGFQAVLDELADGPDALVMDALRAGAQADPDGDRDRQLERTMRALAAGGKVLTGVVDTFLADPVRRSRAVRALAEVLDQTAC